MSITGIIFRLLIITCITSPLLAEKNLELVWPTPSYQQFLSGDLANWAQPTESGEVTSALFGCVRNDGARFHEAIDIKPIYKRKNGEATDPVFAIMNGKIMYINTTRGNSKYGRYIVIVHDEQIPAVYSLYAHLSKVENGLSVGDPVSCGQKIATMGRSSGGYVIPKSRSHVHLEIGLRLSNYFQSWYDRQGFGSKNHHANFNGMNLTGFDPQDFYHFAIKNKIQFVGEYIEQLPTAFTVRVGFEGVPDFVSRYPSLVKSKIPKNIAGWQIDFTWYGMPKQWTPISKETAPDLKTGNVSLLTYNVDLLDESYCRHSLSLKKDKPVLGITTLKYIQLLFGFK